MSATDPVTPESRHFSIRLPRPLWIGLMTVVLVVVAIGLRIGFPIYRQQVAIRAIETRGGYVESWDPVPTLFVSLIGIWSELYSIESERVVVRDVHEVVLSGDRVDDAALAYLRAVPHVRYLDLTFAGVTDAGMPHLTVLDDLQTLFLSGTGVTDAAVAHLKSMKSLRELHLVGTGVSNDGVNALTAALPMLRVHK